MDNQVQAPRTGVSIAGLAPAVLDHLANDWCISVTEINCCQILKQTENY